LLTIAQWQFAVYIFKKYEYKKEIEKLGENGRESVRVKQV